MLVIRFFRIGKKNQPSFKIVITDKRRPTGAGRFVEEVGFWNPVTKEKVLKTERIKYWLSVGVQPSASIRNLLISEKIIEGKKTPVHKKAKKKEEKKDEAFASAPEASADKPVAAVAAAPTEPAAKPEKAPEAQKVEEVKSVEVKTEEKPAKKTEPKKEIKVPEETKPEGK